MSEEYYNRGHNAAKEWLNTNRPPFGFVRDDVDTLSAGEFEEANGALVLYQELTGDDDAGASEDFWKEVSEDIAGYDWMENPESKAEFLYGFYNGVLYYLEFEAEREQLFYALVQFFERDVYDLLDEYSDSDVMLARKVREWFGDLPVFYHEDYVAELLKRDGKFSLRSFMPTDYDDEYTLICQAILGEYDDEEPAPETPQFITYKAPMETIANLRPEVPVLSRTDLERRACGEYVLNCGEVREVDERRMEGIMMRFLRRQSRRTHGDLWKESDKSGRRLIQEKELAAIADGYPFLKRACMKQLRYLSGGQAAVNAA